jgi:hypothetical protein
MISDNPSRVNNVPRVATNDEIPITATARPLSIPISVATTNARIIDGISGSPAVVNL